MNLTDFISQYGLTDIYEGYDPATFPMDVEGWDAEHPLFAFVVDSLRPTSIIEVGSWKGASALHMAKLVRQRNLSTTILCIDSWLGEGVFKEEAFRKPFFPIGGQMRLLQQFMSNVIRSGCKDFVIPFPHTSEQGAKVLREDAVEVDAVYIDASHEEEGVYKDLTGYWPLVRKDGVMFGDDYSEKWLGVVKSVNRFCAENALILRTIDHKWWITK